MGRGTVTLMQDSNSGESEKKWFILKDYAIKTGIPPSGR